MNARLFSLLVVAAITSALRAQDNWPQFRGPQSSASTQDRVLPATWDAKRNIVWRADVPGRGWSSPVVWGERIFLTAVLNDKTPPPRRGLYIEDLQRVTRNRREDFQHARL